jgi:hypothetical protein
MRSLVLPFVALIGAAGCGLAPSTLAGSGGSAAGGQGGRGGGAATGVGGSTGAGGFGAMPCAAIDYVVERLPPEILILLDASGSMNEDARGMTCDQGCGATSKWAETVAAINATVARTDTDVSWGLKFFPDAAAGACGVANDVVAVPVAPGNAATIAAALEGRTSANGGLANGGSTPTRVAEIAAVNYLSARTTINPKLILMATDGLPNCAPGQTDTTTEDTAGTVQSIAAALSAGYPTFIVGVGIGNSATEAVLDQMAVAGGRPRAGLPAYFPVANTAELEAALLTLVQVARTCIFAIPPPPSSDGTASRSRIGVKVDDKFIPHDPTHTNGWDYKDASQGLIEVYGPVCDAVVADEIMKLSILFYCTDF